MTQEQSIQEAKDRVAKKNGYRDWQHYFSVVTGKDLSDEAMLEYSSSQLEAAQKQSEKWETNYLKVVSDKGIEISNLKDKLEAKDKEIARVINEGIDYTTKQALEIEELKRELKNQMNLRLESIKQISELKSLLQQATASSGERGDGFGDLFAWIEKMRSSPTKTQGELLSLFKKKLQSIPTPSTKRFSLEDIQKIIDDWFKSSNENTTYLAHLILQFVVPSEHTEVKEGATHKTCPYCEGMWKHQICIECNGSGKVPIK